MLACLLACKLACWLACSLACLLAFFLAGLLAAVFIRLLATQRVGFLARNVSFVVCVACLVVRLQAIVLHGAGIQSIVVGTRADLLASDSPSRASFESVLLCSATVFGCIHASSFHPL